MSTKEKTITKMEIARRQRLLKLREVAEKMDVAISTVGHWEKGTNKCPSDRCRQYGEIIGLHPSDIRPDLEWRD